MSNYTNRELYSNPRFINRHVGGSIHGNEINPSFPDQYMQNQLNLIRQGNLNVSPQQTQNRNLQGSSDELNSFRGSSSILSNSLNTGGRNFSNSDQNKGIKTGKGVFLKPPESRYDLYDGFLHNKGLIEDDSVGRRYTTTYIDVNSAFRNKVASNITEEDFLLGNDPLDFNKGSNIVFIRHNNHTYQEGELITLDGSMSRISTRRTFDTNNNPTIDIPAGCNFMKVFYDHRVPLNYVGNEIEVSFRDIRGDRGVVETTSFLGNIPKNILNLTYKLRLTVNQSDLDPNCDISNFSSNYFEPNENYFFVIIPKTMHNVNPPYTLIDYNYRIINLSIAGVPLNYINAAYPVGPDRLQGFHVIRNPTQNGYEIEIDDDAILDENGGGNDIRVSRVLSVNTGFPNPNNYTIDLGRIFHNVISTRLISMEFPNSENTFRAIPEDRANNKIYWNDIDDGDFLYSIEIPPGNYSTQRLAQVMENLFSETPRLNSGSSIGATYSPNHFVQVSIDSDTDIVRFSSYKEYILIKPIIGVTPDISTDPASGDNPSNTRYTLTIRHPGHGITVPGERILIIDSINHLGIPADPILNNEHTITSIIDEDTYTIVLPRFNLLNFRQDTGGGNAVTIVIPDLFRLRFDLPDTAGSILGFRNPGEPTSITPFTNSITNADSYEFEITKNVNGEEIIIDNNSVNFSGENYIIMIAKPLETFVSTGIIKSGFAKIILCDIPGNVIFNSFVSTSRLYDVPIHSLSELEIEFRTPDGGFYDFRGLDHSFTIEVVTVNDFPEGTNISTNTGKNYNMSV